MRNNTAIRAQRVKAKMEMPLRASNSSVSILQDKMKSVFESYTVSRYSVSKTY